jgi:response regulator RpfG family c-di-GMP phosphodiesterase
MSPEKARVYIIEDDPDWRNRLRRRLEQSNHTVVGEAGSLGEALKAVEYFEELGVQVATIDGNLQNNDLSGQDAQTVLGAIHEKAPNVKTIGVSGNPVRGVTKELGKANAIDVGDEVTKI